MGFYNLNPETIRDLQTPDAGEVLRRDGGNLASVLSVMKKDHPETRDRVVEFLAKVVPGVQDVSVKHVQKKETLEFKQKVGRNESLWSFFAENMSDGTLRALGVLTALFQSANGGAKRVPLVGIEEPEVAVHPGAVVREALVHLVEGQTRLCRAIDGRGTSNGFKRRLTGSSNWLRIDNACVLGQAFRRMRWSLKSFFEQETSS